MATELDKLVVKIEADLSSLKKGMAQANKEVQTSSQKIKKSLNNMGNSFANLGGRVAKFGSLLAVAFGAIAIKKVVDTGVQIENLQVRLKALFGSAEEGARAFDTMVKFASKVPFTLNDIQQASGNLAVVADDADHLAELLEITGNVASATGLDFRQTAEQIQRSFSGGIASADIFRERGVRAMLGFQVGAEVSIDETIKRFKEVFSEGGEFGNVTADFAKTLTGTLSMLSDKLFQFQKAIADEFFAELKLAFGDLNNTLENSQDAIQKFGREIGRTLAELVVAVKENINEIITAIKLLGAVLAGSIVASIISKMTKLKGIIIGVTTAIVALNEILKDDVASQPFTRLDDTTGNINKRLQNAIEMKKIVNVNKDMAESMEMLATANEKFIITEGKKFTPELVAVSEERAKKMKEMFDIEMEMIALEQEDMMKLIDIFDNAGKSISDTFGQAIASGESFRQSMLDIFQSVVAQVISLIVQLTIIEPILNRLRNSILGSGFNIFSLFGGGQTFAGEPSGSMVYGGGNVRAMGGNVNPNMPYMVGERGAEMFVPKSAGTIVPNNQLGGGIVVEQNLNFATGVSQTVRAEVLNLLPAIKENTLSAVREARLRGGTFAKDFGA
jgi:hypothetical protein